MNRTRTGSRLVVAVVAGLAAQAGPGRAETPSARRLVEQGNAAYARGDFQAALEAYKQADVLQPASAELAFNRGAAYYKLRQFEQAREQFQQALRTRDVALEAKARYNLGNVAYAEALEKLSAPREAIELLREAIEHYRRALDLAPDDTDARANAETAQLLIKDLLDKLRKQQQEHTKQPRSQPASRPSPDSRPASRPAPQASSQPREAAGSQPAGPAPEPQGTQPEPHRADGGQGRQPRPAGRIKPLSREEAERLLQAVRDKQRQRRAARMRRMRSGRVPVRKDW